MKIHQKPVHLKPFKKSITRKYTLNLPKWAQHKNTSQNHSKWAQQENTPETIQNGQNRKMHLKPIKTGRTGNYT